MSANSSLHISSWLRQNYSTSPLSKLINYTRPVIIVPSVLFINPPTIKWILVVCFDEMLIEFVPTVSGVSLTEASGFLMAPSGTPANVAIAMSRLDVSAAFIGKLGDDEFGHMVAEILKNNRIRVEGVIFEERASTALAFVTFCHNDEREYMFYRNPSANMLLKPPSSDPY